MTHSLLANVSFLLKYTFRNYLMSLKRVRNYLNIKKLLNVCYQNVAFKLCRTRLPSLFWFEAGPDCLCLDIVGAASLVIEMQKIKFLSITWIHFIGRKLLNTSFSTFANGMRAPPTNDAQWILPNSFVTTTYWFTTTYLLAANLILDQIPYKIERTQIFCACTY